MKKVLIPLVLALIAFVSCGPDVTKYNDTVVALHTDVVNAQNDFDTKLQNAIETESYADVKVAVDSALAKVDGDITKLKDLKVPSGGEAFHESALALFQSVRNTLDSGAKFASLNAESSEEAVNSVIDEYNSLSDKSSEAHDVMQKAQVEFAKAKGFDLR